MIRYRVADGVLYVRVKFRLFKPSTWGRPWKKIAGVTLP